MKVRFHPPESVVVLGVFGALVVYSHAIYSTNADLTR